MKAKKDGKAGKDSQNPKASKQSKVKQIDDELPEGFQEVSGGRLDGWFLIEEGNKIQGILGDNFEIDGNFGPKRVHKVTITAGSTRVITSDKEQITLTEGTVGVDEKGFLKGLSDLEEGQEIYILCKGKDEPTKEYPNGAWRFKIGAKEGPRASNGRRNGGNQRRQREPQRRQEPRKNPDADDDIPF